MEEKNNRYDFELLIILQYLHVYNHEKWA